MKQQHIIFTLSILFLIVASCKKEKDREIKDTAPDLLKLHQEIRKGELTEKERLEADDSLIKLARAVGNDSLLFKAIIDKGNIYYRKKNEDSVLYLDRLLYTEALRAKDTPYLSIATRNIGTDYSRRQVYDSAYHYFLLSSNYARHEGDSLWVSQNLFSIAQIQKDFNDLFGAKENVVEALEYLDKQDSSGLSARTNNLLGTINRLLFNYPDAIEYGKLALEQAPDELARLRYENNLALVYMDMEEYTRAMEILSKAIANPSLNTEGSQYARLYHNLTYATWKLGKDEVESDFHYALKLRKKTKDSRGILNSYIQMGEFYATRSKFRAKSYLDSAIRISRKIKMPDGEVEALEQLIHLEPLNLSYKDRLLELKDSMYLQELQVKTQFAKMKYDDMQEKERLRTMEIENIRQENQLVREQRQKLIFILLSVILITSSGFAYYGLRQRYKREKLAEVYNTEQRISQDLHDGLANHVFGLMIRIQGSGMQRSEVLRKLEEIYMKIRGVSHDNTEISSGEGYEDELRNLIQSYQTDKVRIISKGLGEVDWARMETQECVALHRAINELLVNMNKHSQATMASLIFKQVERRILVDYRDNGIGMAPSAHRGIGLQNTENRIRAVGGKITFVGKENGAPGVRCEITIPIK